MPSFDIVSEADKQEVRNAVEQATREIGNRFDFKGSDARVEQSDYVLTLYADSEFQLDQVQDVLNGKLAKRGIDLRSLEVGTVEKVGGNKVKRTATVKVGLEADLAKRIVKLIKDSKLKVSPSIQGDIVRVSGAKRDTLQETIQLVRKSVDDFPLQFKNFRD